MSETLRMVIEATIDITYLIVVWGLVLSMFVRLRRGEVIEDKRRVAKLVMIAYALLGLGDLGHVGFRLVAMAIGDPTPHFTLLGTEMGLRGVGTMATSITVTLFYALMVVVWRYRFGRKYGPLHHLLFAAALIRLIMLGLPINRWDEAVPPQPWSIIRNLPLLIQGLGVIYLFMRDARVTGDRTFWWMGILVAVSFSCYMPVVLFVQQVPLIGMLMLPKTLASLVMCIVAYKDLFVKVAGHLDKGHKFSREEMQSVNP